MGSVPAVPFIVVLAAVRLPNATARVGCVGCSARFGMLQWALGFPGVPAGLPRVNFPCCMGSASATPLPLSSAGAAKRGMVDLCAVWVAGISAGCTTAVRAEVPELGGSRMDDPASVAGVTP